MLEELVVAVAVRRACMLGRRCDCCVCDVVVAARDGIVLDRGGDVTVDAVVRCVVAISTLQRIAAVAAVQVCFCLRHSGEVVRHASLTVLLN